ncbi:hypothetical protein V8E55_011435 [Tylopilus felleus]
MAPYRSQLLDALDERLITYKRPKHELQPENGGIQKDDHFSALACESNVREISADVPLTTADTSSPATQIAHSCGMVTRCQWINEKSLVPCGAGISCTTTPVHLGGSHIGKNIERDTKVCCRWSGCGKSIQRKNFHRHVQETHLGHSRGLQIG